MINVKAFEPKHLDSISSFKEGHETDTIREDLVNCYEKNQAFMNTFLFENRHVVCIGGVVYKHRGCGELFLIPTDLVDVVPHEFFKVIYRMIYNFIFPNLGLHRLEIMVRADDPKLSKWAEKLGFVKEGLLRKWDYTLTDHYLYARVI